MYRHKLTVHIRDSIFHSRLWSENADVDTYYSRFSPTLESEETVMNVGMPTIKIILSKKRGKLVCEYFSLPRKSTKWAILSKTSCDEIYSWYHIETLTIIIVTIFCIKVTCSRLPWTSSHVRHVINFTFHRWAMNVIQDKRGRKNCLFLFLWLSTFRRFISNLTFIHLVLSFHPTRQLASLYDSTDSRRCSLNVHTRAYVRVRKQQVRGRGS